MFLFVLARECVFVFVFVSVRVSVYVEVKGEHVKSRVGMSDFTLKSRTSIPDFKLTSRLNLWSLRERHIRCDLVSFDFPCVVGKTRFLSSVKIKNKHFRF